jgi:hypothetical protein
MEQDLSGMIPLVDDVVATWSAIQFRTPKTASPETVPASHMQSNAQIRTWVDQVDAAIEDAQSGASAALHQQLDAHLQRYSGQRSPLLHSVSAFAALGFIRYERAHSEAIAWCMDPRQRHGFGTTLLERLLACVEGSEATAMAARVSETPHDAVHVHAEHPLHDKGRVDILVVSHAAPTPWVIAIEIKVDSGEGNKQLLRYSRGLSKLYPHHVPLRIFATPNGHASTSAGHGRARNQWHLLSLKKLTAAFSAELANAPDLPGSRFLSTFTTGLIEDHWRISIGDGRDALIGSNSKQRLLAFLEMERHLHELT